MRWLIAPACLVAACSSTPPTPDDPGRRYLDDATFRGGELRASLVDPDDGYSRLRLEKYGAAWEALPVWNPRVEPVLEADLGSVGALVPVGPLARSIAIATDDASLLQLGRDAFERYPAQLLVGASYALATAEVSPAYGLAIDPETGRVGSLVRAEMADGSSRVAMTCATCHSAMRGGVRVPGAPNAALDLGRVLIDAEAAVGPHAARMAAWGPGRVDVSSNDASEPARIPDLRPVRFLTHLHQDATLRQRSIATLALRVETLIITSHGEALRPPREIALGLAMAIWALADDLPPVGDAPPVVRRACVPCHSDAGLTGPPVTLAMVGTDATLGLSLERGTGFYRAPSLRGVGTRGPLLHDASAPDLDVFFDPRRVDADFTGGRGGRPIPGHSWNLTLTDDERASVIAYLKAR